MEAWRGVCGLIHEGFGIHPYSKYYMHPQLLSMFSCHVNKASYSGLSVPQIFTPGDFQVAGFSIGQVHRTDLRLIERCIVGELDGCVQRGVSRQERIERKALRGLDCPKGCAIDGCAG